MRIAVPRRVSGSRTAMARTAIAVAAAAGLAMLGAAGTASAAGSAPRAAGALPLTAWVATENGVVPISTATNKPGRAIPPHASGRAYSMVASRNGKTIYDATFTTVSLISAATHKVTRQIRIAGGEPGDAVGNLVLSPDGKTLYAQSQIGNGVSELIPINTATSRPGKDIRVKCFEGDLVMTPNGKTIYIVCPLANSVIPVHTATGKAGAPIRVGDFPGPIAVTPDGKTAYVANEGTGHVDAHTVTPIQTATNQAGRGIPIGTNANFILIAR
jgi:DNA-binding beta-propeller fold protein YncE